MHRQILLQHQLYELRCDVLPVKHAGLQQDCRGVGDHDILTLTQELLDGLAGRLYAHIEQHTCVSIDEVEEDKEEENEMEEENKEKVKEDGVEEEKKEN